MMWLFGGSGRQRLPLDRSDNPVWDYTVAVTVADDYTFKEDQHGTRNIFDSNGAARYLQLVHGYKPFNHT